MMNYADCTVLSGASARPRAKESPFDLATRLLAHAVRQEAACERSAWGRGEELIECVSFLEGLALPLARRVEVIAALFAKMGRNNDDVAAHATPRFPQVSSEAATAVSCLKSRVARATAGR